MRKYEPQAWTRLGRWVHDARMQAGHTDTKAWAAMVGRSTRQLQGLERGEPVGIGTLEVVADALEVPRWRLLAILRGDTVDGLALTDSQVEASRQAYDEEVDREEQGVVDLADVPSTVLLDEIRRRLEESDGHGQQPASITELHPKPPTAEEFDEGQAAARPKPDGSVRGPI